MINVVAIDNDKAELKKLKQLLSNEKNLDLVGIFTDVDLGIEYIFEHKVDLIFMDIEIMGTSGIELYEVIRDISPDSGIIFVTEHDTSALKALNLKAVDYIMKPIKQKDIDNIIEEKMNKTDNNSNTLTVKCFGQFSCYMGENRNNTISWRTSKSEELFAYLIYNEGKLITKDAIVDDLWPSIDCQKAINYFSVTLSYLKHSLEVIGIKNAVTKVKKCYKLNFESINCDMITFKESLQELDKARPDIKALERASVLYKSPYLRFSYYNWAMKAAQEFEAYFQKLQNFLKREYVKNGEFEKACRALCRILDFNPFDEEAIEQLIELKIKTGNTVSASMFYSKYKELLSKEMNLQPSRKIQTMMERIHYETGVRV